MLLCLGGYQLWYQPVTVQVKKTRPFSSCAVRYPTRSRSVFCTGVKHIAHRAVEMSRIYIGRLSYRAREKDVEKFFKGYGKILEVDLKNG